MAETSKATTDHETIRKWAEKHGGHPARVKATGRGEDPGILRIDFPGFSGEGKLEPIGWDVFFKWLDRNELALIYRPQDRFNKIVSRETVSERSQGKRKRQTAKGRSGAQARAGGQARAQPRRAATTKKAAPPPRAASGGTHRKRATSKTGGTRTSKAPARSGEKRPRAR
jgi:hypothetical protein